MENVVCFRYYQVSFLGAGSFFIFSIRWRRWRLIYGAIIMDVFDYQLTDDNAGNSEEHASCAEKLTAENNAKDDGYRMQIKGFAY